jgi:hypothetical protein
MVTDPAVTDPALKGPVVKDPALTSSAVTAHTDPTHGGRWTSLRSAGREWLWHRPDPARRAVRPGDAFVDAGGLEECIPTVRGVPDTLSLSLHTDSEVPVSVALWRNLRGFPTEAPYRSIGVEPMLGAVFDLAEAGPGDAVTVPADGELRWELVLTATTTRTTRPDGARP